MKNTEIRELTTEDLKERIEAERMTLTKLRINHAVSPLENPMQIKASRKTIARLLTELRKRELTVKK
ncbi:MAG: 50S ribosomal protein L29 [Odoribacteraceae bacterium]|jgi:large subunit ribosomal protein L29|nr:50S ribosomal protein L29 [Odoribacteraceae bacterium]